MRWLQSAATSGRSRRVNFGDAFCYFIHTLISKLTERLRRETKGTKNVLIDSENCGFTVLLSALFVRALNFQCVFCCLSSGTLYMIWWRGAPEMKKLIAHVRFANRNWLWSLNEWWFLQLSVAQKLKMI